MNYLKYKNNNTPIKIHKQLEISIIVLCVCVFISLTACKKTQVEDFSLYGKTLYNDEYNKLWRHRANDIEKTKEYLQTFIGVELDVHYNTFRNKFFISHEDEYNIDSTKTLTEYFSTIENVNIYYFWLDFKNLNSTNDNLSLKKMLELLDEFDLQSHTIVESPNHRLLTKFNKKNIFTSYWVPVHDYNGTLTEENEKDIEEIKNNLRECSHNALSSHAANLQFLTEFFPENNLHLWTNGLNSETDKEIINEFKMYPKVKVILVDYENPF